MGKIIFFNANDCFLVVKFKLKFITDIQISKMLIKGKLFLTFSAVGNKVGCQKD